MKKYTIGVDFGTLSARAVLVRTADGAEVATAEYVYPHGVMNEADFGGEANAQTALQHPADYEQGLAVVVKEVLARSGVKAADVAGIGIDFTSCTVLPVDENGTPLCYQKEFENNPHAYAKLWKHHGAEAFAERMTQVAKGRGEEWLADYGGSISSEELLPKALEIYHNAPDVYAATAQFVEGADFLIWKLTGKLTRSACFVGFKALWGENRGFPKEYLAAVQPALADFYDTKLCGEVLPTGSFAGGVTKTAAEALGLQEGTAVAVPVIDAHAAMPAAGVTENGTLLMILGTSGVQLILDKKDCPISGICGKVGGGVVPGYYVYEAGQTSVGDTFQWMMENVLPREYAEAAERLGVSPYDYLNDICERNGEGSGGVLALDWWNGNRNPYNDSALKGALVGMTLQTKPEHLYYALLQSVAFGARKIVDVFEGGGVRVEKVVAAGGIAGKNPLLVQILCDVLNRPIAVVDCKQAGAKGSAIFAAAASGVYPGLTEAAQAMADKPTRQYLPIAGNVEKNNERYAAYCELCDYFTRQTDLMKRLRQE